MRRPRRNLVPALLLAAAIPVFAAGPPKPVMVSVKGGAFFMGSGENAVTERVHETTVRPFLLSETEITQELYQTVMNENPSAFQGAQNPVDSVSWFDAVRFCNALSLRFGLEAAYVINGETVTWNREARGYRLPTEAEWEFAARGGVNGDRGRLERSFFPGFSGGDNPAASAPEYCWYSANSTRSTHPVKTKQPNQLGLYDMGGNVWEWCWDWYNDYPAESPAAYAGPAEGTKRVYRGGSYFNNLNQLRSAYRISDVPAYKARSLGFRVAQNG